MLAIGIGAPAQAELGADQILGIGIQLLNQSQRAEQERARRQPSQQRQTRPDTTPAQETRRPRPARSDAVAEAQRQLNALGYDAGSVDGFSGPQTRRAIIRFQQDAGLPQTGEADPRLISTLREQAAPPMAPAAARPSPGMKILMETDLPGGDYRSGLTDPRLVGTGIDGCSTLCMRDDICAGFTYNTGADICILKDKVRKRESYARAVSGLKGGGDADGTAQAMRTGLATDDAAESMPKPAPLVPNAPPSRADLVHMMLMSDVDAYRAQADELGLAYLTAVATDQECQQIAAVLQGDEFARRDFQAEAAARFRDVLSTLDERPRRAEMLLEEIHSLGEYDFDRGGYQLPVANGGTAQMIVPAVIRLRDDRKRRSLCSGHAGGDFSNLTVEHDGAPGAGFLPMSEADARAYRAKGGDQIALRSTMVIEPRDHGRGPLKGRITNLAAYDPDDGQVLYRWNSDPAAEKTAPPGDGAVEFSGPIASALLARAIEPDLGDDQLDSAATGFFSGYSHEIENGNLPPGSPLPIEALRGKQLAVVVAQNRDRLRQALREAGPELPLTVAVTQQIIPVFSDGQLQINPGIINHPDEDLLSQVTLSDRGLPLDTTLLHEPLRARGRDFASTLVSWVPLDAGIELDRIVLPTTVAMTLDEAAAHDLVGNVAPDMIAARWILDITEARTAGENAIISASVKSITYRWASDGSVIKEVPAAAFPTVASLQGESDAARGVLSSASDILTPADGSRWGGEMTDLLQMRYAPDTVSDTMIERMMIARLGYEARVGDAVPQWGRFFRDPESAASDDQRKARLAEFRDWSLARAQAMPARLTLRIPLGQSAEGQFPFYERDGRSDYLFTCYNPPPRNDQKERAMVEERICAYLKAAWSAPEPLLFLNDERRQTRGVVNLRDSCMDDDYCNGIEDARSRLSISRPEIEDIVRVDRLPVLDAAARQRQGRLAIALEVEPVGAALQDDRPASIWRSAQARAYEFASTHGVSEFGMPMDDAPDVPQLVMDAKAVSARLIDRETGAVLGDLPLADAAPPSDEMLAMPDSVTADLDILGLRLGMSFDEADRLIRDHMQVGKLLTADRSKQLSAASGEIRAYSSGRIYASASGDELIAIFDEPPAAPETVLGIWRLLRLPQGSVDPVSLKATLAERYGEPDSIEETTLAYMGKGLTWAWQDASDRRCDSIGTGEQTELWHDETGQTDWLPPFMKQPSFPVLGSDGEFDRITEDPLSYSSHCRGFLGVRFASYGGDHREQAAGDEIITWLSDNRAYARHLVESRKAPAPDAPPPSASSGAAIKF